MFKLSLLIAALAASVAYAQSTPQGFTPAVKNKLEVVFNSTTVKAPGELLTKAATSSKPEIAISGTATNNASATYMFVMLDLDVPPEQGSTTRRVLLHALNTGFKASKQKINGTATVLTTSQQGPAAYLPPGPPATDSTPHRYVQLLFEQPAALKVEASQFANTTGRFNFNISSFMKEQGLSMPIAANFFRVDGSASNSTTGGGSGGRATSTGGGRPRESGPAQFQGAAGKFHVSGGLVALSVGAVWTFV